jgi:hypothetical protein
MKVERSQLQVGREYYMDGRRTEKGVFHSRDEDATYFSCEEDSSYTTSSLKGKEGLVPFNSEGIGFEEV